MVKLIVMARDEGSAVIMVTHDEALVKALDARSVNVRGGRMTMEKRLETITVDRIAQNMASMDRHELRAHAGVALSTAYFTGYRHWAFSNVSQ